VTATIRPLHPDDVGELLALRLANREHLAPTDPVRPESFYTRAGQLAAIDDAVERRQTGTGYAFAIVADAAIVGQVNLSNVVRGPFCSANLGYWVGAASTGRGLATEAVRLVLAEAFGPLVLHRVEAGTLLDNGASRRVLARNGFRLIGVARRYLQIAGEWRDHVLFERLIDDAVAVAVRRGTATVRPARVRDAPVLAGLVNGVAAEPRATLLAIGRDTPSAERRRLRSLGHRDDGVVLVAEQEGSITGRLDLVRDDHPHGRHVAEVGIVVAEAARRQAIGSGLLEAAAVWARAAGITRLEALVFPDNDASLAFFRRHGFAEEGIRVSRYTRGAELRDLVVLARDV
jgi:ribosomal-protein-alanine N-acetyltransferase